MKKKHPQIKYLLLVVIYKTSIKESKTIKSLLANKQYLNNSKLLIWDNSPIPQEVNDEIITIENIEYVHTPENLALSVIYNRVRKSYENFDYIIILDQDTTFQNNFLPMLNKSIYENQDILLFLPLLVSHNIIVSPGDYIVFKGKHWKEKKIGLIPSKNLVAINSGMVINFDYFKNKFAGYDERLNFYGVDIFFMLEFQKYNKNVFVIDYKIQHESALLDKNENIDVKIFRFNDLKYAWKILNNSNIFKKIVIYLYICYSSLKMAIIYKNIGFLINRNIK